MKQFVKGADRKLLEALRERLLIDKDDLDRELIEQPQRYDQAGQQYVLAVSRRDAAKVELKDAEAGFKEEEAKLAIQYRQELDSSGKKATEAMLSALVETDPGRTAARELLTASRRELVELERSAAELEILKDAFFQRASILRDLCNLYSAGYFSRNAVKGPAATEVIERRDQVRRKLINEERTRGER